MPVDQHEDPFENRLGDALRQAGDTFDTDRSALVTGGEGRGRQFLRRRRAAVAGGVAGVALAGVGGTLLVPWGGDGGGASVAADPTPAPSVSAGPVSGDELLRTLEGLLPEGKISGTDASGTDDGPYALLVHDDGEGGAAISVSLARVEPGSAYARQATACPAEELTPYDACSSTRLPDGSLLRLFQGYEYPDRRVDTKLWTADLVTPEGQQVSLSEWNAEAQKGAPVTRTDPPLSPEQLKKVVTDEAWLTAVDTIPEDSGAGTSEPEPPAGAGGAVIRSTLTGLLPEDVEVVSEGDDESDEYAFVVVDDGDGATFVQINVQPHLLEGPDGELVEDQLYGADAEVLPDGTKLTTQQGPETDKGTGLLMWTVDALRPDGLRVVVSAFNSGGQRMPATRETPALGMDDLRKIALSEEWGQFS